MALENRNTNAQLTNGQFLNHKNEKRTALIQIKEETGYGTKRAASDPKTSTT